MVAVIDIGTNSVKMSVANIDGGDNGPVEKYFMSETTRLGGGLGDEGDINAAAILRAINAIERFLQVAQQYDCRHVCAFATHAFRVATNGTETAERIATETGISVRILPGEEEAQFAFLSAYDRIRHHKPHLYLIDVGGGSVEFVHGRGGEIVTARTLPLGALRLTERFLHSDPIAPGEHKRLRAYVKNSVSLLFEGLGDLAGPRASISPSSVDLVASGGSVTTIKRMCDSAWIHTAVTTPKIRIGEIRAMEKQCLALPLEKRKRLGGIDPERADIIPAGLAVVIAVMEAAGKRVLTVNPGGVRDGVLIHLSRNNYQW